jgi:hypothetical protein
MKLHQRHRYISAILVLGITVLQSPNLFGWEQHVTHSDLNELAADLVQSDWVDSNGYYGEIGDHIDSLRLGAVDEDHFEGLDNPDFHNCATCRCTKHFYHPITGQGFTHKTPFHAPDQCEDAKDWVRADDDSLTWEGAISHYGYTTASKANAYKRLGHVGHLIGDMSQPDHVHLEPHTKWNPKGSHDIPLDPDYIEGWTAKNWDEPAPLDLRNATVALKPTVHDGLVPLHLDSLENYMHDLALLTYNYSSFEGFLYEGRKRKKYIGWPLYRLINWPPGCWYAGAQGDIAEMFDVKMGIITREWNLSNKPGMKGENLGDWKGGTCGSQPSATNVRRGVGDNFWPLYTETDLTTNLNGDPVNIRDHSWSRRYYIERHFHAYPKKMKDLEGNWI